MAQTDEQLVEYFIVELEEQEANSLFFVAQSILSTQKPNGSIAYDAVYYTLVYIDETYRNGEKTLYLFPLALKFLITVLEWWKNTLEPQLMVSEFADDDRKQKYMEHQKYFIPMLKSLKQYGK